MANTRTITAHQVDQLNEQVTLQTTEGSGEYRAKFGAGNQAPLQTIQFQRGAGSIPDGWTPIAILAVLQDQLEQLQRTNGSEANQRLVELARDLFGEMRDTMTAGRKQTA